MLNQMWTGVIVAVVMTTTAMSAQQPGVTQAETKDTNLRAYVELLRADVRAQKVAFITELMEFTDAEDKAFWPIYRVYDASSRRSTTSVSPASKNTRETTTR